MRAETIALQIETERLAQRVPTEGMCRALTALLTVLRPLEEASRKWTWLHRQIPGWVDLTVVVEALEMAQGIACGERLIAVGREAA